MSGNYFILYLIVLCFSILKCNGFSCDVEEFVRYPSDTSDFHMRGVSLGGFLVLEPWITPSLFYQFLGVNGIDAKDHVGMDSYSFCTALGPIEGNIQLKRHWETWVTEDYIAQLALTGIDTLRIPVADWMYEPYGPYIGCFDGALMELDRVIALAGKYTLKVVIDIHAVKRSQNGYDNSGKVSNLVWEYNEKNRTSSFEHWKVRDGNWIGQFNLETNSYPSPDYSHLDDTLHVIEIIAKKYGGKDVTNVVGIEPVNEPWEFTPMDILQQFYWKSYRIVRKNAPHWICLFHDSFRPAPELWTNFMRGCPNYALDLHLYQAWSASGNVQSFHNDACSVPQISLLEQIGIPVVIGEWSLATDNCAMWLNGFNDNLDGYPKVKCERVQCPGPYMGAGQPNTPPDPRKGKQGPYGSGDSYVLYGTCPVDSHFVDLGSKYYSNEDVNLAVLGRAKMYVFDVQTHGQFFWNFRTEFEPRWDFLEATKRGWLPMNYTLTSTNHFFEACANHSMSWGSKWVAESHSNSNDISKGSGFPFIHIDEINNVTSQSGRLALALLVGIPLLIICVFRATTICEWLGGWDTLEDILGINLNPNRIQRSEYEILTDTDTDSEYDSPRASVPFG